MNNKNGISSIEKKSTRFGHIVTEETRMKMRLKKIGIPLNKEHKLKISLSNIGKHQGFRNKEWGDNISKGKKGKHIKSPTKFKKGMIPWNKGKKYLLHSDETKKRISEKIKGTKRPYLIERMKGDNNPAKRIDVRNKISCSLKGRKQTEEHRLKNRLNHIGINKGKNHPNWNGGSSFGEYSLDWGETLKRSIRERDKYICQLCGNLQSSIAFDVHHIDYNKKNCNPDNLITLCHRCHMKTNVKNREYYIKYFNKLIILRKMF